jgi:hypothetical protein
MQRHPAAIRTIVLIWLAWAVILLGYQAIVPARYSVHKPDTVLFWTAPSTTPSINQPYLAEPFLNSQVAWDSEFYLSIALRGYDDPHVRTIPPQPNARPPFNRPLSLNYAFLPGYPALIRLVAMPLSRLGLDAIATATLAGVLISISGTLAAMLALYDLMRQRSEATGIRAGFYLIAFPTGFFLAQVYTEGLFVGLEFGCLALLQRKRWLGAGLLAGAATLTKAIGVILVIPLALAWLHEVLQSRSTRRHWQPLIAKGLIVTMPLAVHLLWRSSFLGGAFRIVEQGFFQCQLLALDRTRSAWQAAAMALVGDNLPARVYYAIEFFMIALGIIACLLTLRRYPGIAAVGLVVIGVSMTCGLTWSMSRYILTVPSVFLVLSRCGESVAFDRIWTLASILLMGMLAALFSFDLWVG